MQLEPVGFRQPPGEFRLLDPLVGGGPRGDDRGGAPPRGLGLPPYRSPPAGDPRGDRESRQPAGGREDRRPPRGGPAEPPSAPWGGARRGGLLVAPRGVDAASLSRSGRLSGGRRGECGRTLRRWGLAATRWPPRRRSDPSQRRRNTVVQCPACSAETPESWPSRWR